MHTLAVLRRTNCFSLRQISCKSRLCRQHYPGPPGSREGRQADRARDRMRWRRRKNRRVASGACVPEALWRRMEEGGIREGGGGEAPKRTDRNEEREKSSTSRVSLSFCSSIVQAENAPLPTSNTPTLRRPTAAPLLHRRSAPPPLRSSTAPSPIFYKLSDLCSARSPAPPFSLTLFLYHRSTEK